MTEKEKTTALLSSFQVSAEHNLDNNHIFFDSVLQSIYSLSIFINLFTYLIFYFKFTVCESIGNY